MKNFHHSRDIDIEFYDNRLIINKMAQWGVNKTKLLAAIKKKKLLAECRRRELKIGNKSYKVKLSVCRYQSCLKLEIKLSLRKLCFQYIGYDLLEWIPFVCK